MPFLFYFRCKWGIDFDLLSFVLRLNFGSVNTLINDAVDIFIKNEEALLNGEYSKSILENSVFKAQMKDIIDISIEKVYKSEEVIEKELKGYKVIHHLLNVFVKAAVNNQQNKTTAFDELALACIPKSYIHKE